LDDRSEFEAVVRPGVLGAIAQDETQASHETVTARLLSEYSGTLVEHGELEE
jgi:hypothetical protein